MITLNKAHNIISENRLISDTDPANLINGLGRILAEPVYSDLNMPPFNKSAMDGYACRKTDLSTTLEVIENIPAGRVPMKKIRPGTCSKIMTGAMVPEGADCVIMVEHTEQVDPKHIRFIRESTKENICYLGEDVKRGDLVLNKGTLIKPQHLAVLASVGKTEFKVVRTPKVALAATGDELTEPENIPETPQIRNSNSYNILAQLRQLNIEASYLGIVDDDPDVIKNTITQALSKNDILILTGGVSMGDKDYVPEVLENLGLELKFNRIAIQPGKPLAFAKGKGKYCFGLSGNPVSSLLQFELVVRPFINWLMGNRYELPFIKIRFNEKRLRKNTDRMQFFPVEIKDGTAKAIEFHGSAHISGLSNASGFAVFEAGKDIIYPGDEIRVLLFPW